MPWAPRPPRVLQVGGLAALAGEERLHGERLQDDAVEALAKSVAAATRPRIMPTAAQSLSHPGSEAAHYLRLADVRAPQVSGEFVQSQGGKRAAASALLVRAPLRQQKDLEGVAVPGPDFRHSQRGINPHAV